MKAVNNENSQKIKDIEKLEEKLDISIKGPVLNEGTYSNAITGDNKHLYYSLKQSFKKQKPLILLYLLMESGVKLIINDLKRSSFQGSEN